MVGVTPGLLAAQVRGPQVVSRSLRVGAGSHHCPHHARIGSRSRACVCVCVCVCVCLRGDVPCGAARWFSARGAYSRDS